jgi:DNA mismatch endonuclease (patch repair protein)
MQGNRSRDTKPELAVRRLLHAAGLRYRVARRPLPAIRRTADIVFGPTKVAVFIDGCYWHGCPEHGQRPKTNAEFWNAKIEGNKRRDHQTDELLVEAGWTVLRFWEHEPATDCAARVLTEVTARRGQKQEAAPLNARVLASVGTKEPVSI